MTAHIEARRLTSGHYGLTLTINGDMCVLRKVEHSPDGWVFAGIILNGEYLISRLAPSDVVTITGQEEGRDD